MGIIDEASLFFDKKTSIDSKVSPDNNPFRKRPCEFDFETN